MSQTNIPKDIQDAAEKMYPAPKDTASLAAEITDYERNAYIAAATSERERGEKEMLEFADWIIKNRVDVPIFGSGATGANLYELFKTETGK